MLGVPMCVSIVRDAPLLAWQVLAHMGEGSAGKRSDLGTKLGLLRMRSTPAPTDGVLNLHVTVASGYGEGS